MPMLLLSLLALAPPVFADEPAEEPTSTEEAGDEPAEDEAAEMAEAGFTEVLPEEDSPLASRDGIDAVQALPLEGFSVEAGYGALMARGFGLTARTLLPHASLDVGVGVRFDSSAPNGTLFGYGVSATGYWKREGTGPHAYFGISKSYKDVDRFVNPPVAYLRWSPFFGAGYRIYLIDRGAFRLPVTGQVSLRKQPGRDLISSGALVFGISVGTQLNVQAL